MITVFIIKFLKIQQLLEEQLSGPENISVVGRLFTKVLVYQSALLNQEEYYIETWERE